MEREGDVRGLEIVCLCGCREGEGQNDIHNALLN